MTIRPLNVGTMTRTWPLLLLAVLLGAVTIYQPYISGPAIRSDGVGYHAWTRALFDTKLSFCDWKYSPECFVTYADPTSTFCQNKYPFGVALLRLPVMAFVIDSTRPVTEITEAEHRACLIIAAVCLWLTAALLTYACALLRLRPGRSSIAIALTLFGTGLFHYGTYDAGFSHVYSALFVCVLLTLAIRARTRGVAMPAWGVFAAAFFLMSIRSTNIIVLSILTAAWLWTEIPQLPRRLRERAVLRDIFRRLWPLAAGIGLAMALQIAESSYIHRTFTISSYGAETCSNSSPDANTFIFSRPMQAEVLLSWERGLFTYYPVFALALVAGFAVRSTRRWTALLAALVVAYDVLYGFWNFWQLGGGMGHRGFIEITPVLAIVLAVTAHALPARMASALLIAGTTCAMVTVQVMIGYWIGTFPAGGASAAVYKQHLRTFESWLSGGATCRPSRCNLLAGRCRARDAAPFSSCMTDFRAGYCTGEGACAPIVAIEAPSSESTPNYVTAPGKIPKKRSAPLAVKATAVGPWERFMLVRERDQPQSVAIVSLASRTYVTVNERDVLLAGASERGPTETFTIVEDEGGCALRANNGKYVSVPADAPNKLTATSDTAGPREHFRFVPQRIR
jgi:hypothetical protein